jgi:hypothetical protein
MANELKCPYVAGKTVTARIVNAAGQFYHVASQAFEAYGANGHAAASYDVTVAGKGGGIYRGDFPMAITTAGIYEAHYWDSAVATAAVWTQTIPWSGTAALTTESALLGGQVWVTGTVSPYPETTAICNGAVCLLGSGLNGQEYIESYESDTSELAAWCRRRFDPCRRRALLKWRWPEAQTFLAGSDAGGDVSNAVHPGYDYAYAIPIGSGALALRGIVDADRKPLKYARSGPHIHCDYATNEFWWEYIEDLVTGFSPGLARCMEYELAIDLAGVVYKGAVASQKRREFHEEYRELALPDAQGSVQDETYDEHNETRATPLHEITFHGPI